MLTFIKQLMHQLANWLLKVAHLKRLSKTGTEAYLYPYKLAVHPAVQLSLPAVYNWADRRALIFEPTPAISYQSFVWQYAPVAPNTRQLPYGSIVANGQVLCLDFDSFHLRQNFLSHRKRIPISWPVIIAPWSHYLDGIAFGGYYDFVILVAAKLCRIKEALPEATFREAAIAYPQFSTRYEQEYLSLLGINSDNIVDSRTHDIQFDTCILGNSGHWFYPNPADIMALKRQVETTLKPRVTERKRIYISRAGRRKVANETALIDLLKNYDFTVIDDKPRSVAEQVEIYKNASFILGPHGASFTNIIWCEPDTHLLELFSPTLIVDHFRYMSKVMNMRYSAYCHVITMNERNQHRLEDDIFVSIADLTNLLDELLVVS